MFRRYHRWSKLFAVSALVLAAAFASSAQKPAPSTPAELGSETAKNGFRNEDEIRDKFNSWKTDADAQVWLAAMHYKITEIEKLSASKPFGEKADVEIVIRTKNGETKEGISIKLVSSPNGFNQIDKRLLSHYVSMWKIPPNVETALKLFVGETPPTKPGRSSERMYLDELDDASQKAVIDFFESNKARVLHDLFAGDGPHAAGWIMIALKATDKPRWVIRTVADTIDFYGDGKVELTSRGDLKIGRVSVQRKGGDAGRESAKMLQFKINPVLLFDTK